MNETSDERFERLLASLERMAGGDLDHRIVLSDRHDRFDAVAHAINVLVGELQHMAEGLRRAKEEAEAASVAKTVFLRNASHEIRTPLNAVLMMAELLASPGLAPGQAALLQQRIVSNGRALAAILDDLLDLSKIEARKLTFELQPLALDDVLADVVASFEPEAQRKGLQLYVEPTPAPAPLVMADAKRARQILTNVIGNAIKFTAHGHVAVRIGRSDDAAHAWIDVSDTGIGLSPDQARLLFEPFAQADATIARRFGGSGLGLAISKRFAEGMAGTLDILASKPGVGTTFRLALPTVVDAAGATRAGSPGAPHTRPGLRGQRVLVVEDNDEVRATTAALLQGVGATVVEAADGQQAIDHALATTFDAILMDVRMPNVDGLEATRRLRASGVSAPIIAVTADVVVDQQAACMQAGCTAYLPKPLELDQLIALLNPDDE